jgi:hypothetical protein
MPRKTHNEIVKFHETIAMAHVDINGFYRFNVNEIIGQFRAGIGTPALLLESHSSDLESQTKMVSNFNSRKISFLLLDFAGATDNFDKQNQVLDALENIALDIISYLVTQNKTNGSWLFGMFDINSVQIEKVGPIFDNMYGWNVIYSLKNHESMVLDPTKWNFNP